MKHIAADQASGKDVTVESIVCKREWLRELNDFDEHEGAKVVESNMIGKTRWATEHEMIFSFKGCFYRVIFRNGATECQDQSPFDDSHPEEITCPRVYPHKVTTVVYKNRPQEPSKSRTISNDEYDELKNDQAVLRALQAAGVDNWDGYDEAQEILDEWDSQSN